MPNELPKKEQTDCKAGKADKSLTLYYNEISRIPMLSPLEENELGKRARAGDNDAVQKLVCGNLRLVVRIARKYQRPGTPLLDLISEGNLGLIEAARRFDPDKELRFSSYALLWMRQAILEYLRKSAFTLTLPSGSLTLLKRAADLISSRSGIPGESLDTQALAREIAMSEERLTSVTSASAAPFSFEQSPADKTQETLGDMLEQTTFRPADEELAKSRMMEHLNKSLHGLAALEREILSLRFGLQGDGPMRLSQVGRRFSLSRERVRQIEKTALNKLHDSREIRSLLTFNKNAA